MTSQELDTLHCLLSTYRQEYDALPNTDEVLADVCGQIEDRYSDALRSEQFVSAMQKKRDQQEAADDHAYEAHKERMRGIT